jgi:cupin 2 domain-containing protein
MSVVAGNLFADLEADPAKERVTGLLSAPHLRIDRIVSHGHASKPGFWYDQDWTEWVLLVSGAAALMIEGEAAPRRLDPGDYVLIPPHVRHRVEWTQTDAPTVWLAIHDRAPGAV